MPKINEPLLKRHRFQSIEKLLPNSYKETELSNTVLNKDAVDELPEPIEPRLNRIKMMSKAQQ